MNIEIVVIASISDSLEAEIIKSLLQSQDIDVWLSREAASTAIGLTVGPLAQVDILVPQSQAEAARKILDDYFKGALETDD
jgi:hypothetical protein